MTTIFTNRRKSNSKIFEHVDHCKISKLVIVKMVNRKFYLIIQMRKLFLKGKFQGVTLMACVLYHVQCITINGNLVPKSIIFTNVTMLNIMTTPV